MKIVLNSDILLSLKFATGMVTDELAELCDVCRERGISIVLPETSLLEFERRHADFAEKAVSGLTQALLLLDRFSIAHDDVDPRDMVKVPNLVDLLEATGVPVEVASPSFEDFQEAHQRACKHLPPSTEKKSDEMRDVVIWMATLGVAQKSGGALLVAKDALFHDGRVDPEADAVGLVRVAAIENAIERIRGLRPAPERFSATLVSAIREDLAAVGIHLPDDVDRYRVSNPDFTLNDRGLLGIVELRLDVERAGVKQFGGLIAIEMRENTIIGVSMSEAESDTMTLSSNEITLATNRTIDLEAAAAAAGLEDVAAFGEQNESSNR